MELYQDGRGQVTELQFAGGEALAAAVGLDGRSESEPYGLTHELISSVTAADSEQGELTEILLKALGEHMQKDDAARRFALSVASAEQLSSKNVAAVRAAARELAKLRDSGALLEAVEKLTARLLALLGVANGSARVGEIPPHSMQVAEAILGTLSQYARSADDTDGILDAIQTGLAPGADIKLRLSSVSGSDSLARQFIERGEVKVQAQEWKGALDDYTTAAALDLNSLRSIVLCHTMLGNRESAIRAAHEAEKLLAPNMAAHVLENLGVLYIRNQEWQEAFNNSEKVDGLAEMAWNSLIRAIAAQKLDQKAAEKEAYSRWLRLHNDRDLQTLRRYIPAEIDAYFQTRQEADVP